MNTTLSEEEFRAEYSARPGLIPIQLDAIQGTASWLDLGNYHCYEGSFRRALAVYAALRAGANRPEAWQCISSLDFLRYPPRRSECLAPSGFIMHAGRCGSTLLAKAIARSPAHMVFGEGGAHNGIWPVIASGYGPAPALFRNLVLHTGRRRLQSHRAHIVKFTSFNIMQFEVIRTAFPDVPVLFLFRDPAEILASFRRGAPGWLGRNNSIGTIWNSAESAIADFFRHALRAGDRLTCMDYSDLSPRMLPAILNLFHLEPSARDLELMRAEFQWDAKSNRAWPPGPQVSARDELPAPDAELLALYEELSLRKIRY